MAKKNSREYWINRAKIKLDKLEKEQDKIEKKLKKSYKEAIKEIKKEIAALYAEGGELTDFQQYRVDGTVKSLEALLDKMATDEEQTLKEGLTDTFKETQKIEATSLDINFQTVNDNVIREVLQTNWSGLTFSERIWDNRKKLASKIKETLNKGLIRGDSLQTMAQNLADVMNKDFNRAMVLVHTETCWVQSEASKRQYEEEGVEQYEFMAFLDNRTTEECKHLDGKVFNVKDGQPGVNMPPMHPRCRSAIIPVVESLKEIRERQEQKKAGEKAKAEAEAKKAKTTTKAKTNKKKKLPTFKKDDAYKEWNPGDFNKIQKDWNESLSKEEIDAIVKYSGEDWYKLANRALRGGKLTPRETEKLEKINTEVNKISAALQRNKTTEDMRLYRGTSEAMFKGFAGDELVTKMKKHKASVEELKAELLGTVVTEKALCSTTTKPSVADNFYTNVIVTIDVNKGSTGLANIAKWSEFQSESEVLMDKGTQFYVKDIEYDSDEMIYYIKVHYLGQEE